jgi:PHD/YefM family antitoxin component YafN of YafNO toxin-antitoxin module
MTQNQLREAAAAYGAAVADLQQPVVLERDGHPMAVIISFEEYQRLRRIMFEEEQRLRAAWLDLEKLLSAVHARPTIYAPEEIETEITAARDEVRKERRDRRRRG